MAESKYGTSGGVELTDALIERLASEAEEGYEPAKLRPRTRRRGRPPLGSEAASLFQVRLEPELREALAQAADGEQTSPSELTREALRSYLEAPLGTSRRGSRAQSGSRTSAGPRRSGSPVRPGLADQQQLLAWADTVGARTEFPRLLRRLILESGRGVVQLGFPAGEGVAAGSWDGTVRASEPTAFIPAGLSLWELSVEKSVGRKADRDFEKRHSTPDGSLPTSCTYVAASLRRWRDRSMWERTRTDEGRWVAVRAYGVDDIETWLESAPVTHSWISEQLGLGPYGLRAVESWWQTWGASTHPELTPDVVLAGRSAAQGEFWKRLAGSPQVTTIAANSLEEVIAFLAAVAVRAALDGDPRLLARTALVDDIHTWRSLIATPGQLLLVAASEEVAAEATIRSEHHVVVPVTASAVGDIGLPPIDAKEAASALTRLGVEPEGRAQELGQLARRSLVALRRNLAVKPELHVPSWANAPVRREARGVLLAGRWHAGSAGDRALLEDLCGAVYESLREVLGSLASQEDPFVAAVDRAWSLVSPFDAWLLLGPHLFEDDLKRLEAAVTAVLGERDPSLDLPEDERWRASLEGKVRTYSSDLRRGLAESVALLGVHGASIDAGGGASGAEWSSYLVRTLLESANGDPSCERWSSIADLLPLLAEAAPDAFLAAVRQGVLGADPVLKSMFADSESTGLFGSHSPHTGLLWALESTAWSTDHFGQTIDLLARLAEIDPGGRLSNRPFKSLIEIYCPWHPETSADIPRRLAVLDGMRERHGQIAWRLMLGSLPEIHGAHFPTSEPRFRGWKPIRQPVKTVEYLQFVSDVVMRLIADASTGERWSALLDRFPHLPPRDREVVQHALETTVASATWVGDDAITLWRALRELVTHHRQFADTDWALPEDELLRLEQIGSLLQPADPVLRSQWLFAAHLPDLGDHLQRDDFSAYEASVADHRRNAIVEVLRSGDLSDVRRLAAASPVAWAVGVALSDAHEDEYEDELLNLIESATSSDAEIALGYAGRRFDRDGWDWLLDRARDQTLSPYQRGRLLIVTRDYPRAWEVAESVDPETATEFWRHFSPYGLGHDFPHVLTAAQRLVEVGRQAAAIRLIELYVRKGADADHAELAAAALEQILQGEGDDPELPALAQHDFKTLFELLDTHAAGLGWERVARLQWAFLPALGFDPDVRILHRLLSSDPAFFVDVVSKVYRAKSDDSEEEASPDQARIATNGYRLLSSWRLLPGQDEAGDLDEKELRLWVSESLRLLDHVDRRDIGEIHIGHVLAFAPSDSDGLWPAVGVRRLLEQLQSSRIEEGLTTQILNNRGVTTRSPESGGTQERDLVEKYRKDADRLADVWPRSAAVLRALATSYERDARREDLSAERVRRGLR